MRRNYDFSQAKKGVFYRPDAEFQLPVYLEADVQERLSQIARQKNQDPGKLVNDFLRKAFQLPDADASKE